MVRALLCVAATIALVSSGCDDEPSDGDADLDGDADTDADADQEGDQDLDTDGDADGDGGTGPTALEVLVQERRPHVTMVPVEGGIVALDLPQGGHVEQESDEDGVVRFEGLDWSGGGEATVVCYLEGCNVLSTARANGEWLAARVEQQGGMLHCPLTCGQDEPVTISGTALGMEDEEDWLTISASSSWSTHQDQGPEWSLEVPPSEPFVLVALEWRPGTGGIISQPDVAWFVVEHEGTAEPTTIEIDFSEPAETETWSGTLSFVGYDESEFLQSAFPYMQVGADGSGLFLGAVTSIETPVEPGVFPYEGQHVVLPETDLPIQPMTMYLMASAGFRTYAGLETIGLPEGGDLELAIPEPMTMITPAGTEDHPMSEPIEWAMRPQDASDPGLNLQLDITQPTTGRYLQHVTMPPGTTSVTIPPLPESAGVDPAEVFGRVATGSISHCSYDLAAPTSCMRFSTGDTFYLVPE